MKRLAFLIVGVAFLISSSGCYCWRPWWGCRYYGNCWGGGCAVPPSTPAGPIITPNGVPQPGSSYAPVNPTGSGTVIPGPITGSAMPITAGPIPAAPIAVSPYPTTALGPMEALPTY